MQRPLGSLNFTHIGSATTEVRRRESGPCFPQIWYGQQRWLHICPPALPHQKDDPILSGVQEGLKVWIKYHIGHGPRLKWSSMFVRAPGELSKKARHQICCATLPAVVSSRDCRSTLRSFSITKYNKVILSCCPTNTYSSN